MAGPADHRGAATEPPALPHLHELVAPPAWQAIDFISDLHLQASQPRTVHALARHLRQTPASAVFILGDLFEAWVGDDARHDAFEAEITALLAQAGRRLGLAFMPGNRDFLVGSSWLAAIGATMLHDPTVLLAFGRRLLLTHGDLLCLADTDYQRYRAQVRNEAWRAAFLAKPLAERRAIAAAMRDASAEHQRNRGMATDIDTGAALQWMTAADSALLVHGHTHRPGREALAAGRERAVLSDWDFTPGRAPRGDALRLTASGLQRIAIVAADAP